MGENGGGRMERTSSEVKRHRCGADVRRFLANANCYEAQVSKRFSVCVP